MIKLQHLAISALLAFALGAAATCHAQQKPVRLLIFAPGGPVDFVARNLAVKLGPLLGTGVAVEPRPGANGVIAAQAVANSDPDGTTLLFSSSGLLTITPTLTKDLPYDIDQDFIPVSRVVISASAVVIGASIPANNMREFVEFARARKEPLVFGSPGVGNIAHLWIEMLKAATNLELTHVPYKGIAAALTDVIGGRVAGTIGDLPVLLPQISGGKIKVLGLIGNKRNSAAPTLPTIYEQGYPGVDALSWYGVLAPAKTPPAITARLGDAITRALADPDLKEKLASVGVEAAPSTPDELARLIRSDRARWAKIIVDRKITAE